MEFWSDIVKSVHTIEGKHSVIELEDWKNCLKKNTFVKVKQIDLNAMKNWQLNDYGEIEHTSKGFFRVTGLSVSQETSKIKSWNQPIIDQQEIGILGFLCTKINGVLHFLVQAKIEPGNVNVIQLCPTVQATRSNFKRVHKGGSVPYLNYFLKNKHIIDRLQSEQGGRFFRKFNRNVISFIKSEIKSLENFRWMTLGQISYFLNKDNVLNMDARSVLSHLMTFDPSAIWNNNIINSINYFRFTNHTHSKLIGLDALTEWSFKDGVLSHEDDKFFHVIGASVNIDGREVNSWDQPMIAPVSRGICGTIIRRSETDLQILIQCKFECGLGNRVEIAPSLQSLIGRAELAKVNKIPFIDYFGIGSGAGRKLYSVLQSEEGGRFYQEENLYEIAEVNLKTVNIPESFQWISFSALKKLIAIGGLVNIQLRGLALALWLLEPVK